MTFSEKLSAAMREKHMSFRMLSEMTGIPKSAIQRYTSGETEKIPIDRMKLMAEALSIDPATIMGWDTDTAHTDPISDSDKRIHVPQTSEARILAAGVDRLPKAERERALEFARLLFVQYADYFERTDDDDSKS